MEIHQAMLQIFDI